MPCRVRSIRGSRRVDASCSFRRHRPPIGDAKLSTRHQAGEPHKLIAQPRKTSTPGARQGGPRQSDRSGQASPPTNRPSQPRRVGNAPRSSTIIAKLRLLRPRPGSPPRPLEPSARRLNPAAGHGRYRRKASDSGGGVTVTQTSKTAADGSNSGPKNGSRDRKQQ